MSKMFFSGIPTAIDVRALIEAFPALVVGQELAHDEVAEVIAVDAKSSRYRTVTNSWRRQLLAENNIDLGAVAGTGFRVLAPDERITRGVTGFQSGTRKQMRSIRRATLVRTEDAALLRKQDILQRAGAAIANQASALMKTIELPGPPEQLPRPSAPAI